MRELLWPVSLAVTGVVIMALAGSTGSHTTFWTGLAVCGAALVSLIRLVLKESSGKAQE